MRYALFILSLLLVANAAAQINPATQIRWPQPSCGNTQSSYSPADNQCFPNGTGGPGGGLPVMNPTYLGTLSGPTGNIKNFSPAYLGYLSIISNSYFGNLNNNISGFLSDCTANHHCAGIADPYGTSEAQPFGGANAWAYGAYSGPKASDPYAQIIDFRMSTPQWLLNNSGLLDGRTGYWPGTVMNFAGNPGLTGNYINLGGAMMLQMNHFMGSRNFYNDKTNLSTFRTIERHWGEVQGGGSQQRDVYCYGNGDCVGYSGDTFSYGGPETAGDEGNENMRQMNVEAGDVYQGTMSGTASTAADGTVSLTTTPTQASGTQGEGRLLIDLTKKYNAGNINGIGAGTANNVMIATCTGCNWDGTFGLSTQTTLSNPVANRGGKQQADDQAEEGRERREPELDRHRLKRPSLNSFPESNVTLTVASSTGFTVGHLACIWDYDYECEKITAVGTGTVTIATARKPHPSGAFVTTGGLAGYAIEFEADRVDPANPNGVSINDDAGLNNLVRNAIPIMFNYTGNGLSFFNGYNGLPPNNTGYGGRAYTASGYTNPYDIYPAAKTIQVYDTATGTVDGTFVTQPWTGGVPASGDLIEQPHYFIQHVQADANHDVGQYIPTIGLGAHNFYNHNLTGIWQGNDYYAQINSKSSPVLYAGYPAPQTGLGLGQLLTPSMFYLQGPWRQVFQLNMPPFAAQIGYNPAVIYVGCGPISCANWTAPYYMFAFAGNTNTANGFIANPSNDSLSSTVKNFDVSASNVTLGIQNLASTSAFVSGKGQNWNPNSDALTSAGWGCDAGVTASQDTTLADPFGGTQAVWKIVATSTNHGCGAFPTSSFPSNQLISGSIWIYVTGTQTICANITNAGTCFYGMTPNTWYHGVIQAQNPNPSFLSRGLYFYSPDSTAAYWVYNPVAESGKTISTSGLVNTTATSITTDIAINQITGLNIPVQEQGTPTAGHVVCWKETTVNPPQQGYCSTQPDSTGACTCN